jgi:hypothetical protein
MQVQFLIDKKSAGADHVSADGAQAPARANETIATTIATSSHREGLAMATFTDEARPTKEGDVIYRRAAAGTA